MTPPRPNPARALLLALSVPVLLLTACERPAWLPWPGASDARSPALEAAVPAEAVGEPFPELEALNRQVAEVRAILPTLPPEAKLAPTPPLPAPPAPREVLRGQAQWVRRGPGGGSAAPPAQVQVWLDDRWPPGGELRVRGEGLPSEPWALLGGVASGQRDAAFDLSWRVAAPTGRLWFFKLVGLPLQQGGQPARSVEGYLLPAEALTAPAGSGLYAVDFGPPWPRQPPVVAAARALAPRLAALAVRLERLEALPGEMTRSTQAQEALREAQVPQGQEAQRRADLAAEQQKQQDLQREQAALTAELRPQLAALMAERAALARAWSAHAAGNAHRWQPPAGRRADYAPLRALEGATPLERAYRAVAGDVDAHLAAGMADLRGALAAEAQAAPLVAEGG